MCNKIAIWWAGIRNTEISPERTWFVLTSSQVGTMSIMGKARNVNTTSRAKASSQSASRLVIGISEAAGHLDMDYSIECLLPVHTMALYIRMISHPVVGCHVDHSNENIITHVCSVVPWLWWGQQNDTCATENVYVCVCVCVHHQGWVASSNPTTRFMFIGNSAVVEKRKMGVWINKSLIR